MIAASIYNDDCEERRRKEMTDKFGERVKDIRSKKKLTQEQVGERAGINPKYLGEIERGIKSPTAVVMCRVSSALGVPICEILTNDYCPHNK